MNAINNIFGADEDASVKGWSILITGGTAGIGRAAARLLARQGANVLIAGRDPAHLDSALAEINEQQLAGSIAGIIADLATKEGVVSVFEEVDRRFGKLDVLINNAALAYQSITEGTYEDWEQVTRTNLLAYMACTWHAVDRMRPKGSGHIINIGSMSADVREKGSSVYVGTKAGIQGFSETLRKEVNELGIKITLIEPGAVITELHGMEDKDLKEKEQNLEMLLSEDIARAVYYALVQPARCDVVEMKIKPHLQLI
jgi:NADP-dependent 3-hydroxy acid dehydrogenase YdfG